MARSFASIKARLLLSRKRLCGRRFDESWDDSAMRNKVATLYARGAEQVFEPRPEGHLRIVRLNSSKTCYSLRGAICTHLFTGFLPHKH